MDIFDKNLFFLKKIKIKFDLPVNCNDNLTLENLVGACFEAVQDFTANGNYRLKLRVTRKFNRAERRITLDYINLSL